MKDKGRRVVNDKFAISCSIEVLSIGDKYARRCVGDRKKKVPERSSGLI